jgi:hypothetical protein
MRGISASHLADVNVFAVRRPDRLPGSRLTVLVARWQLIARMRRLRDDATLPNRIDQPVLADNPIAVANEVNEQSNTCGSV